jgi:integrase
MASISRDPSGNRSIQFVAADGKRKTIRLGKVNQHLADKIKVKVEVLAASVRAALPVDNETAAWLAKIDDDLAGKLAAVGLFAGRLACPTLGDFLDAYRADRGDVGDGTRTNYGIIGSRLFAFFGQGRRLSEVNPGDADRFADHLRAEYAQATAAKTIKMARQIFRRAVRLGLVAANPFDGLKAGTEQNRGRNFFVTAEAARKVLDACPDREWRLLVALARYGGLRTPSETLALTWPDVLWDQDRFRVTSPKTKRQGKGERLVPLFPELRAVLADAFEAAPDGALHVVTRYRDTSANLRTQLMRIIRRAGLVPWPRLFQNLRASRETELAERFPLRVVTDWLGNSPRVAHDHYLSTTEEHFRRAAESGAEGGEGALQKPVQQPAADSRTGPQGGLNSPADCDFVRDGALQSYLGQVKGMTPTGFEPVSQA